MEDNFNKHLGNKLKLRRLALGLTQTKVAKAINVTFQQIQKYEKGTNGVSSIRLLQLANYLKVPINYFFEDFSEYLVNLEKSQEGHMNVNYNFLVKLYSELNADQKLKFNKSLQISGFFFFFSCLMFWHFFSIIIISHKSFIGGCPTFFF